MQPLLIILSLLPLFAIGQDPDICECPENWEPLCGVDGVTYGNACFAECGDGSGEPAVIACEGECPCPQVCTWGNCMVTKSLLSGQFV